MRLSLIHTHTVVWPENMKYSIYLIKRVLKMSYLSPIRLVVLIFYDYLYIMV